MSLVERAIGVIPAAGRATRLGLLPGSKELLPLGVAAGPGGSLQIRPACSVLLENLRASGIRRAFVVLREEKWDIPGFLGDGERYGVQLAYAMMRHPFGAPFTVDAVYPFVRDVPVALGFPDTVFGPPDAYRRLLDLLETSSSDVALGLFPTDRPHATDMVECDPSGRVVHLHVKPDYTDLALAWCIAVWTPAFTEFLHEYVREHLEGAETDAAMRAGLESGEHYIGQVIAAAIGQGMDVRAAQVSDEKFVDIGTPETYAAAVRLMQNRESGGTQS